MTAERFLHLLQDPLHLYNITYQELRSAVSQYPYCQNLRLLMALKSKLDQHQSFEEALELAATYSIDRTFLHQQFELSGYTANSSKNTPVFDEEVLELKELDSLEKQLEEKPFEFINSENKGDSPIETPVPQSAQKDVPETENTPLTSIPSEMSQPAESKDSLEVPTATSNTTLIDRIMNEWLPPVPEDATPPIDESKIVELETFMEADDTEVNVIEKTVLNDKREKEAMTDGESTEKMSDVSEMIYAKTVSEETKLAEKEQTLDISTKDDTKTEEEDVLEAIEEEPIALDNTPDSSKDSPPLVPQPKHSFSSWIKMYRQKQTEKTAPGTEAIKQEIRAEKNSPSPEERNAQIKQLLKSNKKKKKRKKKKQKKEPDLASKSIMNSEEVISETLADLLAAQGYSEKAIKMYERLRLIFPEKSSFFAQKIKELSYFKE